MTVFGIGGCMALMLVGFGLKDSIFAIVDIQYGEIQLYDGNIILSSDAAEEEKAEVLSETQADKDVDRAAEGLLEQVTVETVKSGMMYIWMCLKMWIVFLNTRYFRTV